MCTIALPSFWVSATAKRDGRRPPRLSNDLAGVADLAAGLGVERRSRQHDFARFAGLQGLHEGAIASQRDDLAV